MYNTKTNTNTHNGENKNAFVELLKRYNTLATTDTTTDAYTDTLQELATACTASVLKKCYDVSGSKVMLALRRDVMQFANNSHNVTELDRMDSADVYETTYTKDGDERQTVSKDFDRRITNTVKSTYGDGADLVQTAVIAIIEHTKEQRERESGQPIDLERPYTVRRIKSKVWIKDADTVGGWETVKTSPIREIYREIRRAVQKSASVQVASNVYTYIADVVKDDESGAEECIYRRMDKYADVGTETTYGYSADEHTAETIADIKDKIGIKGVRGKVFDLRLRGYGYKAIARYTGLHVSAVQRASNYICKKLVEIGITPEKISGNTTKADRVYKVTKTVKFIAYGKIRPHDVKRAITHHAHVVLIK